jgi:aldose 1-epimerase
MTDKKTIINPTNHFYINLSGDFSKNIETHAFFVDAESYLPMNEKQSANWCEIFSGRHSFRF